tara:strand:- start:2986 stop:3903 length:918 start_codon:yes stop_codon:yes gene_type:complete
MKYQNEEIIKAGVKDYNLKTFSWYLIDVCNQACKYCGEGYGSYIHRPKSTFFKNDIQKKSYKNVLKLLKIKNKDKFDVDILGGEPTLHPDIYEIIETLCSFKNSREISLITNLKKSYEYFKEFDKPEMNKLLICPSIHMDYYNDNLLKKIIDISKFKNIKFIPIVMVHDNPKFYSKIIELINILTNEKIEFTVSFLTSECGYKVNYEKNFFKKIKPLTERDNNRYNFETKKNNYSLTKHDIYDNNFYNFKGWKCKPLRYKINHFGAIYNACTGQPLSFISKEKCVECPLTQCGCDIQWNYEKSKV